MSRDVESLEPDARVKRRVGRAIVNWVVLGASLAVLGYWASTGFYTLETGSHAVILFLGQYDRTETSPGIKFHLPPPLESHETVNVQSLEREEFGFPATGEPTSVQQDEGTVQTSDNNIVNIGFVVQYRIKDAFFARFRVASPQDTLRDTAQAAIREVIGRTSVDDVLTEKRGEVQTETQDLIQETLDRYESGLLITRVELQDAQPPPQVKDAFDDVTAADQDKDRIVNQAEGYANEVLPEARAEAAKLREEAQAYREARIAEATGAAARFSALLVEYEKAPEVTRKRLYLETMEEVMPRVEKVIIESGTNVLPYIPIGRSSAPSTAAPPPPPPAPAGGGEQP